MRKRMRSAETSSVYSVVGILRRVSDVSIHSDEI